MFPSQLSNCQEDVDEFLLTISNFSEAADTPVQPPNPHAQEDRCTETLNMFSVATFMPSGQVCVVDAEINAYISDRFF